MIWNPLLPLPPAADPPPPVPPSHVTVVPARPKLYDWAKEPKK